MSTQDPAPFDFRRVPKKNAPAHGSLKSTARARRPGVSEQVNQRVRQLRDQRRRPANDAQPSVATRGRGLGGRGGRVPVGLVRNLPRKKQIQRRRIRTARPPAYDLKSWNEIFRKRNREMKKKLAEIDAARVSLIRDHSVHSRQQCLLESEIDADRQICVKVRSDQIESERRFERSVKDLDEEASSLAKRHELADVEHDRAMSRIRDEKTRFLEQWEHRSSLLKDSNTQEIERLKERTKHEISMLSRKKTDLAGRVAEADKAHASLLDRHERLKKVSSALLKSNEQLRSELAIEKTGHAADVRRLREKADRLVQVREQAKRTAIEETETENGRRQKNLADQWSAEKRLLLEEMKSEVAELRRELSNLRDTKESELTRHRDESRALLSSLRSENAEDLRKNGDLHDRAIAQERANRVAAEGRNLSEEEEVVKAHKLRREQAQIQIDSSRSQQQSEHAMMRASLEAEIEKEKVHHAEAAKQLGDDTAAIRQELGEIIKRSEESFQRDVDDLRRQLAAASEHLRLREAERIGLDRQSAKLESNLSICRRNMMEDENRARRLHQENMSLKGNVRVFVRLRPNSNEELGSDESLALRLSNLRTVVLGSGSDVKETTFRVYKAFPPNCSQQDIFGECHLVVQSVLDGMNGSLSRLFLCRIAHSLLQSALLLWVHQDQEGRLLAVSPHSVCSFTLQGPAQENFRVSPSRGIIPRSVATLFEHIEHLKTGGWAVLAHASVVELPSTEAFIRDLLSDHPSSPSVVMTNTGPRIQDLTLRPVETADQAFDVFGKAQGLLASGSRSQFVTTLNFECRHPSGLTKNGRVHFVSIAVSEESGDAVSLRFQQDLLDFRDALIALQNGKWVAPSRGSLLVKVLSGSLSSPETKVLLFSTFSPSGDSLPLLRRILEFASEQHATSIEIGKRRTKT